MPQRGPFRSRPQGLTRVGNRDFPVHILDLGRILRDFGYNLLRSFPHNELVAVHHHDFGFGNHLDALDLEMVHQKLFVVAFGQLDHNVSSFSGANRAQ